MSTTRSTAVIVDEATTEATAGPVAPLVEVPTTGDDVAITYAEAVEARSRVKMVTAAAFTNGLAIAAFAAVLPLYASQNLGMTEAQYARLTSVRMTGTMIGVVVLGAIADRFGTRATTIALLLVGGVLHAAMGVSPLFLFVALMPLIGAVASAIFVNLNYLTQAVGEARQGWSNTLYRAAGMLASIIAPIIATRLLNWPITLYGCIGAMLAASTVFVIAYPLQEPRVRFAGWANEFRGMGRMYAGALAQRAMILLVVTTALWHAMALAAMTFVPLRLTEELGVSNTDYGYIVAGSSGIAMVVLLTLGPVLSRTSVKRMTLITQTLGTVCLIALGFTTSVWLTVTLYVLFTAAMTSAVAPMFMWVTRARGPVTITAAMSTQKVFAGFLAASSAIVFAMLQPVIGTPWLLIASGVVTLPLLLLTRLVPERAPAP
jgi:MFS family permease